MLRIIVITDLTQMPTADGVCIAGIDQYNKCIRPVLPTGVCQRHLYIGDKLAIRPRAKVTFDLHKVPIKLPHIENLGFDPDSIEYLGLCAEVNHLLTFNFLGNCYRSCTLLSNSRTLGTRAGRKKFDMLPE